MNTLSDALPDSVPGAEAATATMSATRPFYWSVRREIWEHRSLYIAPLVAAGFVLFGFLLSARTTLAVRLHKVYAIGDLAAHKALVIPYLIAAVVVILTGFVVAVVYSLGALHNERRDRSVLFWKSLPVSDLTVVLSKASIPLLVVPAILFAVTVALQLVMFLLNAAALMLHGLSPSMLWNEVPLPEMSVVLAYGLITQALWGAPIYGWLLLVSSWAKRVTFLWAVLPPLGLCVVEKLAFDSSNFAHLLGQRLTGGYAAAFNSPVQGRMTLGLGDLDPVGFFTSMGLWGGLIFAAAFLGGAVGMRRYREPI